MNKKNIVASYLMKIVELCDQLAIVGEEVKSEELVPISFEWVLVSLSSDLISNSNKIYPDACTENK